MPGCKPSDVSLLQVEWQWTGGLQSNLSFASDEPSVGLSASKTKDPVLLGLSSLLFGIIDAEGNPMLEAEAQLQATTVVVVISVLATLVCFVIFLLASFAPPSVGPPEAKEAGGTHSPGKQLCPELVTPAGGELLTIPTWVYSTPQPGEPLWKESFIEFCDLEGNARLRIEVQVTIDGNEHVVLKDAFDNRTFAFCALPVGNAQAPLRIHREDGELFALLGQVPESGGFALAGCSTSQRYLPVQSRSGCSAMRVTSDRTGDQNDGFVALAEGPIVRLGGQVDAGLALLGLIALRRQEALAIEPEKKEGMGEAVMPSAFGPQQDVLNNDEAKVD